MHSSLGFQRPTGRRSYRLTLQATIAFARLRLVMFERRPVFAERGKERGDGVEVRPRPGILHPAFLHQRDQVLVDLGVAVDERTIIRRALAAHLLQDLYTARQSTIADFAPRAHGRSRKQQQQHQRRHFSQCLGLTSLSK